MKLRKDKNNEDPVRLNKKENKRKINKKDIRMFLIVLIMFLILFVVIPMLIYSSGCLDSTNYYYRLNSTTTELIRLTIQ